MPYRNMYSQTLVCFKNFAARRARNLKSLLRRSTGESALGDELGESFCSSFLQARIIKSLLFLTSFLQARIAQSLLFLVSLL